MAQEEILYNDITLEHRSRMLNLKKYYPFFKLTENSFDNFKQGQYADLDMGYIVMAVLRFFIEENNFKEKEVTYPEYVNFVSSCIKNDFSIIATNEEYKEIADYIFEKIKNDGKPFEFGYYDPVDKKRRVSRMKLIESTIRNSTVWYSISADAIEFYLETKEIKDESRISVQQLLLEKMIRSKNFKGGRQVIIRINDEVERLMLKKREVEKLLSTDVFAGFEAYQEFVDTGMKWFDDEQKLFVKNKELIESALSRVENESEKTDSYVRVTDEIYELDNQLKVAMNRHGELLRACMEMQKMTDNVIRKNKLSRLRNHFDYRRMLEQMMKSDSTLGLELMIKAMLRPKAVKRFDFNMLDDCLLAKNIKVDEGEKITKKEATDIVFADEVEEERISHNYGFFMKNLLNFTKIKEEFYLSDFNEYLKEKYPDRIENILNNADYYSFFVHLCGKKEYATYSKDVENTSFLDEILKRELADYNADIKEGVLYIQMQQDKDIAEYGNITSELKFNYVAGRRIGDTDGDEES